tara:strand:- start:810 stop:1145 length:336 start_codon:yes stop_codon:yes gene_type:complete
MEYLNKGHEIHSGSFSTILTAGGTDKLLLKTVHLTNFTSSNAQVELKWVDSSDSNREYFLARDVVIPNASSFQAIDGTFVLDNNDSLKARTDISGSVQASVSYLQISNDEG